VFKIVSINLIFLNKVVIDIFYIINNNYISFYLSGIMLVKPSYFCIRLINMFNLETVFLEPILNYVCLCSKNYSIFVIFEMIRYS